MVGKALGYLFGLLNYSDVESIRNNINILAKNQRQLTHVVNASLSVIRLSHEQIIENRKSINSVIESLYELNNLTRTVAQEVNNTHISLQQYIKFHRVPSEAHVMVHDSVDKMESTSWKTELRVLKDLDAICKIQ